jgi:hypothetical protein
MVYVVVGIRCLLGGVFLVSSASKVLAPRAFTRSVQDLGVLPVSLVRPVVALVIAAELAIWTLLAVPGRVTALAGFLVAAGLLAAFSVGIAVAVRRDVRASCRCFGTSTARLGPRHVVRNVVLAVLAVLGTTATAWRAPVHVTGELAAVFGGLALAGAVVCFDRIIDVIRPGPAPESGVDGRSRKPSVGTGELVGAFATATVDGAPLTDAMLVGETLVGFFSPRCRVCALRLPKFVEYARGLPDGRNQVLAVVIGDAEDTAAVAAELSPVARVVIEDRHGVLKAAFQVQAYPTILVVAPDPSGRLVVRTARQVLDRPPAAAN